MPDGTTSSPAAGHWFFVLQTGAVQATAVSAAPANLDASSAEDSALMGYSSESIGNVIDVSNEPNAVILKGRILGHVLE